MDQLHRIKHVYSEGWSDRELAANQTRAAWTSIVALFGAVFLIAIPFVLILKYSLGIFILIEIAGFGSLFAAALTIYWWKESEVSVVADYTTFTVDQRLSMLVFIGNFTCILYNMFMMVFLTFWERIGSDYQQSLGNTNTEFQDSYTMCLYFVLPLLLSISLCQGYGTFSSYITIHSKAYLRVCVYIFVMATMVFSAITIHYTNQTLADLSIPTSPYQSTLVMSVVKILCVVMIVLGVLAFISILFARVNQLKTLGYLTLIFVYLLTGTSFIYFRESEGMRMANQADCNQQMRITHADWIKDNIGCTKYVEEFNCHQSSQALHWETDNRLVCLNANCCDAFADQAASHYFQASFSLLLLIISAFGLSVVLLQIDTKINVQAAESKVVDYLCLILLVGLGILCIFVVIAPNQHMNQQDYVMVAAQIDIKQNKDPIVFPAGMEGVTGCEPLTRIYKSQFNLKKPTRVSILAPKLQVVVIKYINDPKLFYLPVQLSQQLLYPGSPPNIDGFLGVQGDGPNVSEFLNTYVEICGVEDKTQTKVDIYELKETRMLYHPHHSTIQPFTADQQAYLKTLKFVELKVIVKDITTKQELNEVILYFYNSESDCGKVDAIPSRMLTIREEKTVHNLVTKEYFYGAEKSGYFLFCSKFTLTDEPLEITLVPKNRKPGQFTLVMETPLQKQYQLSLGASIPQCTVGFFNNDCGGMHFHGSRHAQAISVDQLAEAQYTFFVYFEPIKQELKLINERKSKGEHVDTATINNDFIFDDIKPVVTLYAQEQEKPIIKYQIPQLKSQLHNEPNLTWLVLCVDGTIGDISQVSPQQFWTYADSPNKYQRAQESKELFPNVCTKQ